MTTAPAIDVAVLTRQLAHSREAFGPGLRTEGILAHIAKELEEIRAKPTDLEEWADAVILSLNGALRVSEELGLEPADVITTVLNKLARNELRTWPDWRTLDPNAPIEHDRTYGVQ